MSEFLCGFGRKKICGSAARQPLPSSGRKVARVSVTEGARGTSNQQKAEVFSAFEQQSLRRCAPDALAAKENENL
ncbi:MAG TPA: hypothetical protein DCE08_06500 [Ruminococcaceae bacterium]|nr:hypothetical protein [Oscillospiraceae bacterium]